MLPFPRDRDLKYILEHLNVSCNLLSLLCVRTPNEDSNKNQLNQALTDLVKAQTKLIEVSNGTSG